MMMMMTMRRPSSLRVRAEPRHLPYIYIYTYITYIPSNDPGSAADEPRRRGAFGGARPDAGDVTWQPVAAARGRAAEPCGSCGVSH